MSLPLDSVLDRNLNTVFLGSPEDVGRWLRSHPELMNDVSISSGDIIMTVTQYFAYGAVSG